MAVESLAAAAGWGVDPPAAAWELSARSAQSRSTSRRIFPVEVRGRLATTRTACRRLKRGRRSFTRISRLVASSSPWLPPGTTKATGTSPSSGSEHPATATSATPASPQNSSSSSCGANRHEPLLIMSLRRPTIDKYPPASRRARSPVCNQPSRRTSAVSPGSRQYPSIRLGPRATISPTSPAGGSAPVSSTSCSSTPGSPVPMEPGWRSSSPGGSIDSRAAPSV